MKSYLNPLISIMVLFLSACSTTSHVVIRSEPSAAKVFFIDKRTGQNALLGTTPISFERDFSNKNNDQIMQLRIEKDGFEPKNTAIASFGGQDTFVDIRLNTVASSKKEISDAFEKSRVLLSQINRLVLTNRYSEALLNIEKILELDPKNSEALSAKGSVLFLMKDFDGARKFWTQALDLNPNLENVRSSLIEMSLNGNNRMPATQGGQ
ncbi:MAG: tetratricopeptide repeat protein [Bdellovibrionales bacterium]|nr:tetratricopeptide repeat protein [Bdellovibrionales bacterium]